MFVCIYVNTKLLVYPFPPHRNSLKLAYTVKKPWWAAEELQSSWFQAPALVQLAVIKATGPTPMNKKGIIWERVLSLASIQNISVTWQPSENKCVLCVFSLAVFHTHTRTRTRTRTHTHTHSHICSLLYGWHLHPYCHPDWMASQFPRCFSSCELPPINGRD